MKGLLIAATKSGAGKTTLTLALLAALRRRGLKVAPFKVGPDFIDPGHHRQVARRPSHNLDGWMLSREYNRILFSQGAAAADIALVEGVMGLYDGYDGRSETGSSAEMAKWLGLPVLLVVDAGSMARSAAAVVKGFETFDPRVTFAGVVFNQLGSRGHLTYLTQALAGHVRVPCLGGVVRDDSVAIPERHLGLVTDQDHRLAEADIACLARLAEENLDLTALLASLPDLDLGAPGSAPRTGIEPGPRPGIRPGIRLGVALDQAFCFYYQANLDLLTRAGADLVFFSPIRDNRLPPGLDGLYFGGGYPELYARDLAANQGLRDQVREASLAGMPVYGECGGFMYLGRSIRDMRDREHAMTGCLPFTMRMLKKRKALGYRQVRLTRDTLLGKRGRELRGHEFHYSQISGTPGDVDLAYQVADRQGLAQNVEGFQRGNTLGSYFHLHFGSHPAAADAFVAACRKFKG